MRSLSLNKKTLPKLAVLAAGLAVATMAATVHPLPAQAFPSKNQNCANCHAVGGSTTAAPSTLTPAAGAAYTVAITLAAGGTGNSGYAIIPVTAGTGTVNGGNTGADLSFTATMTAPAAAGTYKYNVYTNRGATDPAGQASGTTYTITVAPAVAVPVASFTTSVASGVTPLPVTMTDTSSNTPTSWAWTLGDGTTSTVQNPSVTYTTAGAKTVTLVATNAGGASTMVSKTITVTAPVVSAPGVPTGVTATPGSGQAVVSWVAVAGATSYTVTASPGLKSVTTRGTTATITGLTNGVSYTFTVTATNAAGTSAPSLASAAVTPTLPSAVPVPAVPATVPLGSPNTGAGGASQPGPWTGLGGLVLLLAGAAMVPAIRRRRRA